LNTADVERFLASQPYAVTTRETYRRVLILLIQLDLAQLGPVELLRFVDCKGWGNSQQYVALCACRKFLAWHFGSDHQALCARIKRIRPRRQRVLSAKCALDLLASFDTSNAKGARDLAIAALALDTGLRCSELCRLRLADVELDQQSLQVIVKGGQWGMAVYSPQTEQYLREWLAFRRAAQGVGTVFVSTHGGKALTREGLQTIVKKWGVRLGFKLSPHDLRRSFATLATIFGAPTRMVQIAGRWNNIEMVEYYTQSLDPAMIAPFLPVARLTA